MNLFVPAPGFARVRLPEGLALEWPGGRAGAPEPSMRLRLRHRHPLARLRWAARHCGVRALGVTLARHPFDRVERLIDAQGLRGRAEVQLLDCRALDAEGGFDRIASVGMFEHVGRARLAGCLGTLRRPLRPGGLLLNHGNAAGGTNNPELGAGMGRFIERRIFPGGERVHVSQASAALARVGAWAARCDHPFTRRHMES